MEEISFDHQFIHFTDSGMVGNLLAQEHIAITYPESGFDLKSV